MSLHIHTKYYLTYVKSSQHWNNKTCRNLLVSTKSTITYWIHKIIIQFHFLINFKIIEECRRWKTRRWDVQIKHIYRAQNVVADIMAKTADRGNNQWRELGESLVESERMLMDDWVWVGLPISRVINEENYEWCSG